MNQDNFDNSNNTFWRQFSPRWHAGTFDPIMLKDSGEGLNTLDSHVCTAPRTARTKLVFVGAIDMSTLVGIEAGREITGTLKVDPDIRDQDNDPRVGRFEDLVLPAQYDIERLHFLAELAGYTIVLDAPFPEPPGPDPNPVDRIVIEAVYDDELTDMILGDLHDPVMGRDTGLALGLGSLFRTTLYFESGTLIGDSLVNLPVGTFDLSDDFNLSDDFDLSDDLFRVGQFMITDHEGIIRVTGTISSVSISTIPEPGALACLVFGLMVIIQRRGRK